MGKISPKKQVFFLAAPLNFHKSFSAQTSSLSREPRVPRESRNPREPRVTRLTGVPRLPRDPRTPRKPRLRKKPTTQGGDTSSAFAIGVKDVQHTAIENKDDTESSESEGAAPFDCELCRKHFDSEVDLKVHEEGLAHMLMRKATPSVKIPNNEHTENATSNGAPSDCELCQKHFDSKADLKEHETGLTHMLLENAHVPVDPENKPTNPKERARPLDQGLSETCTLHAIANATVESLTEREIDVKLDEVLGALKQAEYVDVYKGNRAEEFDGAVLKRLTNKKTGKSVDVTLTVAKFKDLRKSELFAQLQESIKFVLVYNLNRPTDPEVAWHCVYIHKYDTICGKKKFVCYNSWGDEEENPVVDVDKPGNVVYGVVTESEESRHSSSSTSKPVSDGGMFSSFSKFFHGWGQPDD